jgi:hypothetical protein
MFFFKLTASAAEVVKITNEATISKIKSNP